MAMKRGFNEMWRNNDIISNGSNDINDIIWLIINGVISLIQ